MTRAKASVNLDFSSEKAQFFPHLRYFLFGLLLPLGFAPFHLPGLAILSLALFYHGLSHAISAPKSPFLAGLLFGLGFFGFGISWVYISIHDYGHLHGALAACITFVLLLYLALFPALVALIYSRLRLKNHALYSASLFATVWILSEFARASFLSGFPWALLGFGQFDTPVKYLIPILGIFGAGFITCLAAAFLSHAIQTQGMKRKLYLAFFVTLILFPFAFKNINWTQEEGKPISAGIIQANLSMRDKWDDKLFWNLLALYKKNIKELLGTELIVLPESAIPLPAYYVSDFLHQLEEKAAKAGSAVLFGIPHPANGDETYYYNALMSAGMAKGTYFKQHLVPFGESVPSFLEKTMQWLEIPPPNFLPGKADQALIRVHNHPIAALICYELAYANILRQQLPEAEWIVSISDDGWFGHSLAMYQQQQMAQVLALQTGRYHVVSNNDGLSSVINRQGEIIASLPANRADNLKAEIIRASGETPWVRFGDMPILVIMIFLLGICIVFYRQKTLIFFKDKHA